jgi:hypothetical protein
MKFSCCGACLPPCPTCGGCELPDCINIVATFGQFSAGPYEARVSPYGVHYSVLPLNCETPYELSVILHKVGCNAYDSVLSVLPNFVVDVGSTRNDGFFPEVLDCNEIASPLYLLTYPDRLKTVGISARCHDNKLRVTIVTGYQFSYVYDFPIVSCSPLVLGTPTFVSKADVGYPRAGQWTYIDVDCYCHRGFTHIAGLPDLNATDLGAAETECPPPPPDLESGEIEVFVYECDGATPLVGKTVKLKLGFYDEDTETTDSSGRVLLQYAPTTGASFTIEISGGTSGYLIVGGLVTYHSGTFIGRVVEDDACESPYSWFPYAS